MKRATLLLLSLITIGLLISTVSAAQPYGANLTEQDSETAPADLPEDHDAIAGNVTEIDITGFSTTQSWQGYFGNVSGTIQLADTDDYVMYNWSLASPEGEVYASVDDSISWTDIQCFNFSATGEPDLSNESETRGETSQTGMNLSQLESAYGIKSDDVDGVNETFSLDGSHESGANLEHDLFYTNNLEFSEGECLSTHLFNGSQEPENSTFQEVLLYDPHTDNVVFTSLLDEETPQGFDQKGHDFEMLVLEDGHGTDVATTTYYFYVELE